MLLFFRLEKNLVIVVGVSFHVSAHGHMVALKHATGVFTSSPIKRCGMYLLP